MTRLLNGSRGGGCEDLHIGLETVLFEVLGGEGDVLEHRGEVYATPDHHRHHSAHKHRNG